MSKKLPHKLFCFFAIISLLLTACSSDDTLKDLNLTEEELYAKIEKDMEDERYDMAVEDLQALEARYPFGVYAEQAQLLLIYAYYRQHEFEAASAAAERFIRLHPQNPQVDYAYYLKGLSSFTEGPRLV